MKKIGVLTYHRSINYGAVWQGVSLVEALKRNTCYDVELIDFVYKNVKRRDGIFKTLNPASIFIRYRRNKGFSEFLKNQQLLSNPVVSDNYDDFENLIYKKKYSAIVVGSDEVWKINSTRPLNSVYWLNGIIGVKRFSYAASSNNTNENLISADVEEYIKKSLNEFNYISVRDAMTKKMLSKYISEKKINLNYDPGFLLDLSQYVENDFIDKERIRINKLNKSNKKIIGIMVRDLNTQKKIYENLHKDFFIISIMGKSKWSDINYNYLTPTEWLNSFDLFSRLITDFFHGAIFSMKKEIPFICIDTRYQYKNKISKIEYMMDSIDISKYYFCKYREGFDWEHIMDFITYIDVDYPKEKISKLIKIANTQFDDYVKAIRQYLEEDK